jgi:hypothetical protein
LAVEEAMDAMIIVAIQGSHANRAGSFEDNVGPIRLPNACRRSFKGGQGIRAPRADQHLKSAEKNEHGNKDNAILANRLDRPSLRLPPEQNAPNSCESWDVR